MYKTLSSTNRGSHNSSFSIWMPFVNFSFLDLIDRISGTKCENRGP